MEQGMESQPHRADAELSIYIHIPFCKKKCAYCDFLSFAGQEQRREDYVRALLVEIRSFSGEGYRAATVFLGGGTPSYLPSESIERIMEAVKESFRIENPDDVEITMEANPGTLTGEKLKAYRRAGINRLSLGLQSALPGELEELGRIHDYADFAENYRMAREAGFHNINIDLMSGLPGQHMEQLEETLRKAAGLSPEHLSVYDLILEEGTPMEALYGDGGPRSSLLPAEEEDRRMYHKTREILEEYGYCQYEISNYSLPGYVCRHNLCYWETGEYLGFGLGAASYFQGVRRSNLRELSAYIETCRRMEGRKEALCNALAVNKERLTKAQKMEEFMFLGLRKTDGVSKREFYRRFGCSMDTVYETAIAKHQGEGLLQEAGDMLRLSRKGMDVSNYVMADFLLP